MHVKKGKKPAHPLSSDPEKKSGRDERGRWISGVSANPKGRPPITAEMKAVKALAEVERAANVAKLVSLRDSSDDPWVVFECIKLLLQYSDGKPALAGNGAPLVAMNFAMVGGETLSPADAYRLMLNGQVGADHPALRPAIEGIAKARK